VTGTVKRAGANLFLQPVVEQRSVRQHRLRIRGGVIHHDKVSREAGGGEWGGAQGTGENRTVIGRRERTGGERGIGGMRYWVGSPQPLVSQRTRGPVCLGHHSEACCCACLRQHISPVAARWIFPGSRPRRSTST